MALGHVFNHVLIKHHRIGGLNQGVEAVIDFRLACRCYFVMLALNPDSQFFHDQAHLGSNVLLRIGRSDRKITFLMPNLVSQVGHFVAARVPNRFFGIDTVESPVGFRVELDVIENKELGFRSENRRVGQPGAG